MNNSNNLVTKDKDEHVGNRNTLNIKAQSKYLHLCRRAYSAVKKAILAKSRDDIIIG